MEHIVHLLRLAGERNASDLHLTVNSPPLFRINGALQSLDGFQLLSPEDITAAFVELTTPEQREQFYKTLELDFSYTLTGVGRIRCNVAQQRGAISFALRLLPPEIPTVETLGLPPLCKELAMRPRGLVMVSGPTGSGKSTTLAAMIHHINAYRTCHVVTIEDPVEYSYPNLRSAITQRELGSDTLSFAGALKHVLRQDPDVILVGEMRDLETAASVLTVAETGHLVLTTGHAPSASQAMERFIDMFPPEQRYLAQARLASLLIAVLCQTLVPRADGSGRVAAVEIMLGTPAVANLIRDGKIYQLPNVIRTSIQDGMLTMDQALVNLFLKDMISGESLMSVCNDKEEIENLVGRVTVPVAAGVAAR